MVNVTNADLGFIIESEKSDVISFEEWFQDLLNEVKQDFLQK